MPSWLVPRWASPRCAPSLTSSCAAPRAARARSARAPRALRRRPGLRSHRCARARPLAARRRLWTLAAGSRPPRPGAPRRRSTAGRRAGRQRGWVRPPLSRVGARAFLATLSVPRPSLAPRLVISLLCVSRHAAGPPSYESSSVGVLRATRTTRTTPTRRRGPRTPEPDAGRGDPRDPPRTGVLTD